MSTQYGLMALSALKPNPDNPRMITEADVEKMCVYLRAHGFLDPIEARASDGLIVAGHRRYLAAIKLGLERVPVLLHEGLSDADATAYAIAHNRSQEDVDWNRAVLADQVAGMDEAAVRGLGFDEKEIAHLFDLDRGAADDEEAARGAGEDGLGSAGAGDDDDGNGVAPGEVWIIGPCTFQVYENLPQSKLEATKKLILKIGKMVKAVPYLEGEPERTLRA